MTDSAPPFTLRLPCTLPSSSLLSSVNPLTILLLGLLPPPNPPSLSPFLSWFDQQTTLSSIQSRKINTFSESCAYTCFKSSHSSPKSTNRCSEQVGLALSRRQPKIALGHTIAPSHGFTCSCEDVSPAASLRRRQVRRRARHALGVAPHLQNKSTTPCFISRERRETPSNTVFTR